jgi:hypothetical protein
MAKSERITIYAGGFGRRFDSAGAEDGKPLGGSEEAVIAMAKALVEKGREVYVYAPLPKDSSKPRDGARWIDGSLFDPAGPHGTLLAWRCPKLVPRLKGNGYPVILWLMDPEYGAGAHDYAEADDVVFLTETHKDIIHRKDGFDGGGSVVHVGLPILPELGAIKRDHKAVMWAVSPDRGLLEFLRETWPGVIDQVPDAKLHIFYGLEPLERAGKQELADNIRAAIALSDSVAYHGGVPDGELYNWYQRCGIFAYRGVGFEETQSISLCKALALGCYPVVNNQGCLTEVAVSCGGLVANNESYTHELVQALKHHVPDLVRTQMAERAQAHYSVDSMVKKMLKVIEGVQ